MCKDYEQHFVECSHCRARQKFHRSLDGTLAVLTSLAALFFLFALATLQHIKPLEHVAFNVLGLDISDMYHMLMSAGIAGLCFSVIALARLRHRIWAGSRWNAPSLLKSIFRRRLNRCVCGKTESVVEISKASRAGGFCALRC